jgi:Fe-S-cluster-containing dehydrogenase component/formate-dependent nitrite reductase membrane component NrfD
MQYGFLIDHTRCIGCHACTVACKAENDVPLGSFRTWVKYVEKGRFPTVRRHFAVLRCNHCTDAPCVTICPVNALEKRADGIVDIDRDACIGCRACMQACPYDALYLNEDLGAVEKCHFCAHRVEKGLEPACVIVCPEEAIIAGDLHDSSSTIAMMLVEHDGRTLVRRSEQGTGPNVHYLGVEPSALRPGSTHRPDMYLWSDRPPHKTEPWPLSLPVLPDARTVLDAGHRVEWGWGVSAYLVTKGIAGGAAMLAPLAGAIGLAKFGADYLPELLALTFIAMTGALLVEDLYKPLAFLRLFTQPNFRSWLVKGAWIINIFVALILVALLLRWTGRHATADMVRWAAAIAGAAVAGYTAFLFAQCKGRDLWESPWLLPHLLVQALMCGGACLLPAASSSAALKSIVVAMALCHLALALIERFRSHETDNARQAGAFLSIVRVGPLRAFRDGLIIGVGLGIVVTVTFPAFAFIPVLFGLLLYEHAFVRAGQLPPLS